jgi:hypothetical protein
MDQQYKLFDPKSLATNKILELKLVNVEINKEDKIGVTGKDNYIVDLVFENIFHINDYNDKVEEYFDQIYKTILEETGIFLENIEVVDHDEIYAWGTIFKEDDKYYVYKPDNTE